MICHTPHAGWFVTMAEGRWNGQVFAMTELLYGELGNGCNEIFRINFRVRKK